MKNHLADKLLIIIFFISLGVLTAQETGPSTLEKRPTVGLALGGGGARGIAHIGILKALEEEGIPIDYIAGTSMGSIIGGLYVSGYSSSDQVRIVKEIDWKNIFSELPEKTVQLTGNRYGMMDPLIRLRFKFWKIYLPVGLNNGQKISNTLFRYTSAASFTAKSNFNNLKIPFRAIAVDTRTGKAAELGKGELSQAIRASMAIPLVFNPAYFDGRLFIDGGVINNLPTDVVKKMGADIIIACDVDMLNPLRSDPENIADIAKHTFDITTMALKKENVELADIYIQPDLGDHSIFDYSDFDTLIESGYKAAMMKMDEIKAATQWEKPIKNEPWASTIPYKITVKSINVTGLSKVRKPVVIQEFPLSVGDQYTFNKAEEGILKIYATDLFENVWLELENTGNNEVVINIHVIEKYPRTIAFGLKFNETEGPEGFAQIIHYNLLGWGERFMPFIRYSSLHKRAGLEIVNDRYQGTPLTLNNGFFIERDEPYIYTNGKQTGQIKTDRFMIKVSAGVHPYRKLLMMAGTRAEYIKIYENQIPGIEEDTLKNINFFAKILWDTTDHDYFPHRGTLLKINTELIEDIGFDSAPNLKTETSLDSYFPIGSINTIKVSLKTGNSLSSLPLYDQYKFGGPEVFPGYYRDELIGNNIYNVGISHKIKFLKRFYITTGISAGLLGNDLSFDKVTGGIYTELSVDTPAGPARIGYGINNEQTAKVYISMGYDF